MIEDLMFNYIMTRVKDNGLFNHFVETKNFRGLMVIAAEACVGIVEATGHNDGPLVNSIQRTVDGVASPNEFWCMDFIMTLRAFAESLTKIKSPLIWTQSCAKLWSDTILKHANGGGHTKLVLACDGVKAYCVDGNTTGSLVPTHNATGKVDRNGNGVFYTTLKLSSPELVGFIKPVETHD